MGEYKNGSYRKRACECGLDSSGSGGKDNHEHSNTWKDSDDGVCVYIQDDG
jgi:hypothetical protein